MHDEQINLKNTAAERQKAAEHDQAMTRQAVAFLGRYWINDDYDEPDEDGAIGEAVFGYSDLQSARIMARHYARLHRRKLNVSDDVTGEILYEYDAEGEEKSVGGTG